MSKINIMMDTEAMEISATIDGQSIPIDSAILRLYEYEDYNEIEFKCCEVTLMETVKEGDFTKVTHYCSHNTKPMEEMEPMESSESKFKNFKAFASKNKLIPTIKKEMTFDREKFGNFVGNLFKKTR